ncbi:MAG: sensor histidine kinase [Dehalococcoidales bacterium]|nr:sensor histidine kinase [Dehalococcoidales bacterium]
MAVSLRFLKKGQAIKFSNVHIWIIITLAITLTIFYRNWPWREWAANYDWFAPILVKLSLAEFKYHIIGSLFLIPIIYSTFVFRLNGSIFSLILSIDVFIRIFSTWHNVEYLVINTIIFFLPMAVVSTISLELYRRKRETQVFIERDRDRQKLVSQVINAQEIERKRISYELHDDIIQKLVALASYIENTPLSNFNEREIKELKTNIIKVIDDLRRLSRDLRPSSLDRLGLVSALNVMIANIKREFEIDVSISIVGEERKLPDETEINIFRIIQEGLNNIKRHSGARIAEVILEFYTEKTKITIKDNGKGFDPQKEMENFHRSNRLGLLGIRERAKLSGGDIQIKSSLGQGTELFIEIPNQALIVH